MHLCVYVCAREDKEEGKEFKKREGSVRKPLAGCSLVQCGVICRVRESQTHARARSLVFLFTKNLKPGSYVRGDVNSKKRGCLIDCIKAK